MKTAMILSAHADDETLGAGGIIRRLLRRGDWDVRVVILSDGLLTVRSEVQDNRPDTYAACRRLGLGTEPVFLGFPDQRFDTLPMAELAGAVLNLKLAPDLIVAHVDTDLNLDHRIACDVAKIVGRPRAKPVAILGTEIPNTTLWNGQPFPANYYVGLDEEDLEAKVEAFACYTNELMPYPHPWSREGLRLLAQYHGMQSGHRYAEAFHLVRGYAGLLP